MALREKLVHGAAPYLDPGEQVQQVFGGRSGPNPYLTLPALFFFVMSYRYLLLGALGLLGLLVMLFLTKPYVFAVTDRAILVLTGSNWRLSKINGIEARLPRATRIGPISGLWGKSETLGKKVWIHWQFHKDVLHADMELMGDPPV